MSFLDWFFWRYGIPIQVLGYASMGILVALGMNWLANHMSQDVDAYTLLDKFAELHRQTATPLETQEKENDDVV